MSRLFDTIHPRAARPRVSEPAPMHTELPPPKRRSGGSLLVALLIVGGFFAATRPTVGLPTVSADKSAASSSTELASATSTPDTSQLGPPQPSAGTSLEETVILDKPLSNSQAQSSASSAAPPASNGTGVSPDSFSVRILNGSGASGQAATTQATLKQKGFTVVAIGTATNTYDQSVLYFSSGHEAAAAAVQSALGMTGAELQENTIAAPADVLVVIGKK